MKITIQEEVFQKYPQLKVVIGLTNYINNHKKLKESGELLNEIITYTQLTFHKENIKNHNLISPWAVAQAEFGKKSKHYQTSIERLLNQVLKKENITTKNTLTNILRYLGLKYLIPYGVDDLTLIQGDVEFKIAKGKEKINFIKNLRKGTLYYRDHKNILGTKLDYWKNKKTKLDETSTKALIHFDLLPPLTRKQLNVMLEDLENLLGVFCKGKIKFIVLDKKNNSIEIKNNKLQETKDAKKKK